MESAPCRKALNQSHWFLGLPIRNDLLIGVTSPLHSLGRSASSASVTALILISPALSSEGRQREGRPLYAAFLPSLMGLDSSLVAYPRTSCAIVYRPYGADSSFSCLPTACAVGCILSPFRGWSLVGTPYAALKRRSSTVVSAFGMTESRALPGLAFPSASTGGPQNQSEDTSQRQRVTGTAKAS